MTHFIAIDDREFAQESGGKHLSGHFILTKLRIGLNTERVEAAVTLLNSNPIPPDFTDRIVAQSNLLSTQRKCPPQTFLHKGWKAPKIVGVERAAEEIGEGDLDMSKPASGGVTLPCIRQTGRAASGAEHASSAPKEVLLGPPMPLVPGSQSNAHGGPIVKIAYKTTKGVNAQRGFGSPGRPSYGNGMR